MAAQSLQISTQKGLSAIMLLRHSEQIWMHSRQHAGHRFAEPLVTIAAKHSSHARMHVWQAEIHGSFFMVTASRTMPAARSGLVCNAAPSKENRC